MWALRRRPEQRVDAYTVELRQLRGNQGWLVTQTDPEGRVRESVHVQWLADAVAEGQKQLERMLA